MRVGACARNEPTERSDKLLSVETAVVAGIVEEGVGGLRKLYQAGFSAKDFPAFEEEVEWIEQRTQNKKPVNPRIFRKKFQDFDWLPADERLQDLLDEFKNERAFIDLNELINSVVDDLEHDNAVEKAQFLSENISMITRAYSPVSDILMHSGWRDHMEEQRKLRALRKAGVPPGIPTDIKHLDHHWDGLVNGRMIVVLARPGEGKSMLIEKFAVAAGKRKYRTILFSPEMSPREHRCRYHTLASADPDVKEALGLERSFRNRALMNGIGYNIKSYQRFCEYLEEEYGETILLTATHRGTKMTPGFIEARIADLSPDLVLIDPLYKLKAPRRRNDGWQELSDVSDAVQDIAKKYNIPIVVTNQSHRQGGERGDAPHKDKSYNSDVPIQEADHVIGVKHLEDEDTMILRCTKSRFGRDFRFEMKFRPNTGAMYELTEPKGSYYNGKDENADEAELREAIDNAVREEEKSGKAR
jgi:hypothetical protein